MEQEKSKTNQKSPKKTSIQTNTRRGSESQKPQLAGNATPAAGKPPAVSRRSSIVKAVETPESVEEPPPPPPPEPKYETDPDRNKVFPMLKMTEQLTALLQERMETVTEFVISDIKELARSLANDARALARQCGASERYAYVAQAHFGEVDGTGLVVNSKCLWDPKNDNYARADCRNQWNIFGAVVVYALYKD